MGLEGCNKITDTLTAAKYRQIFIHPAVPTGRALIGESFLIQQNNEPKHTARVIKQYLKNRTRDGMLTVLNWPAKSSHMNIIELVWTYMEKEKLKRAPTNL